jgi:predicted metal-dependent phosphoesterase TrpH
MSRRGFWPPDAGRKNHCRQRAFADLHIHSSASDGCLSPAEIVKVAAAKGFTAISLCDHDTVAGLPEAIPAAAELGLELIPGVELSTYLGTSEVHILGYCFDWENPSLIATLQRLCDERIQRIGEMVRLLREGGVNVEQSPIDRAAAFGSVGRLHLARALVDQGFASDIRKAFAEYIGRGKPAYVPRAHHSPREACEVIAQAGGIPVLAHPFHVGNADIAKLIEEGVMGIEAFYGTASADVSQHYCNLAEEWGLLVTGGSDCHQSDEGAFLLGTVKLDYSYVEEVKKKAKASASCSGH